MKLIPILFLVFSRPSADRLCRQRTADFSHVRRPSQNHAAESRQHADRGGGQDHLSGSREAGESVRFEG